jgi:hypothetical protein
MNTTEDYEETEIMRKHLQTLRERISHSRKEGMDTKIVEIKLMNVTPKIMMAQATRQKKDLDQVAGLLAEVEREMKQLRKEQRFEEVLKQVEEEERQRLEKESQETDYVKLSQEEIITKTHKLINQASEYFDKKEFEKVFPIYLEIQGIYKYLPKELKRQVYHESIAIYNRLKQSGIFRPQTKLQLFFKRIRRRLGL